MRALIADDENYMLEYLKKLVDWSTYGFEQVLTAGGGSLARDLLEEYRPELLITDIRMPRISGLDLCALVEGISDENHHRFRLRRVRIRQTGPPLRRIGISGKARIEKGYGGNAGKAAEK